MKSNRSRIIAALVSSAIFLMPAVHADETSPAEQQLNTVMADYWDFVLRESPLTATGAGVSDYNDRLSSVTPESQLRRNDEERLFLARTRDIDRATLSQAGLVNAELFEWVLEDSLGAYENNLSRIPFNTFSGFFMATLNMANGVRMDSVKDYEDYIARMADVPRYFEENIANMDEGVRSGFVLPHRSCSSPSSQVWPLSAAETGPGTEAASVSAPMMIKTLNMGFSSPFSIGRGGSDCDPWSAIASEAWDRGRRATRRRTD